MDDRRPIYFAIIASCIFHLLLVVVWYLFLDKYDPSEFVAQKEQVIQVDLGKQKLQIADILPPAVEKVPEKTKHMGLYNSKVEEETVATDIPRAPGRPKTRGGEGAEAIKKEAKGMTAAKPKKLRDPEADMYKQQEGFGKMPEDFYPDYKRGGHTYLNVLKHPDAAYFVMMKRVLKLAWDPTHVLMNHSEILRNGRVRVVLGIAIDQRGNLSELFVIKGSGLGEYDDEALRAVKVSAPFNSPPKNFTENDGILRITWTFTVSV